MGICAVFQREMEVTGVVAAEIDDNRVFFQHKGEGDIRELFHLIALKKVLVFHNIHESDRINPLVEQRALVLIAFFSHRGDLLAFFL